MKLLKKILLALFIFVLLFFIAGTIYVKIYGQGLIVTALRNVFKRNIVVEVLEYQFPFGVLAKNVKVDSLEGEEFIQAKQVHLQFLPELNLMKIHLASISLEEPFIRVIKHEQEDVGISSLPPQENRSDANQATPSNKSKRTFKLEVDRVLISDGTIFYQVKGPEANTVKPFTVQLQKVNIRTSRMVFPLVPLQTTYDASAQILDQDNPFSGSQIKAQGWVNLAKKDLQSQVTITSLEGKSQIVAKAISLNNQMKVEGEVKASDLFISMNVPSNEDYTAVKNMVSGALESMGLDINAKFSFETKLDEFQVNKLTFSGDIIRKPQASQ